jgi:hypothetical protein
MAVISRSRIPGILIESLASTGPIVADLEPLEWEELWTSARDHSLTPYLHQRWQDSGFIAHVPPGTAKRFAEARVKNTERNRRLMSALEELWAALEVKGISTLVSKGLPVAHAYYGDLGLRVLYDLDLLIKPADSRGAIEVLRSMGYDPFFKKQHLSRGQALFWRPEEYTWNEQSVFDPKQPVFVELHTSPWKPRWHGFRLECNLDLWEHSRIERISGVPLRVPPETKLLLHLAVHYACNVLESNARLMHLVDMILLLKFRALDLDWGLILSDIRESRAVPFCYLALDLARRVATVGIPPDVLGALKRGTPPEIVDWLESSGVEDAAGMNLRRRRRELIYFLHWNMAAGWREKSGVLLHSLRSPWREGAGLERWRLAGRRMFERARFLARPSRI